MNSPEQTLEELRGQLEGLRSLLKFPPWDQAVDLIERQCKARERECYAPVASVNEALAQNFKKGIVVGLRLAIRQPELLAAELQEQFNAILDQERENVG